MGKPHKCLVSPDISKISQFATDVHVMHKIPSEHKPHLIIVFLHVLYYERECGQFEMVLKRKSKLRLYRELKGEIGFEEYLKYVKEPLVVYF